jgi:hypothetical protein
MSQREQDETLGRLIRERGEIQTQVSLLASRLKTAGRNFSRLGDDLQTDPPVINVVKDAAQTMLSELWIDLAKYSELASALGDKSDELDDVKKQCGVCG